MCGCRVHGVAQVVKEDRASPAESHLDVCVQEALLVEEICCGHSN